MRIIKEVLQLCQSRHYYIRNQSDSQRTGSIYLHARNTESRLRSVRKC